MTNKAIAAFVAGVFLFNDIASAADFRNLAPQTGVTVQEFKDRYLSGYILLSHKAVNSYIEKYLSIEDAELIRLIQSDIRWEKVKVRYNGKQETIDVRIVPIRKLSKNTELSKGFLTSTGQLAHIGLGNVKNIGSPSIYIDYDYRYDPDLLANEKEKIVKWEGKRRELGRTYGEMRQWIRSNPEDARVLAAQFHKTSRSIKHLYDEIKRKYQVALNADNLEECQKILNFDVMCEYFDKFGLDEESNDANLAASLEASVETTAPNSADAARVQALIRDLKNEPREVRKKAAQALGDMGPAAADAIWELCNVVRRKDGYYDQADLGPSAEAAEALVKIGAAAIPHLIWHLNDPTNPDRKPFAVALRKFGDAAKDAVPVLKSIINADGFFKENEWYRSTIFFTLIGVGKDHPDTMPLVIKFMQTDSDDRIRQSAIRHIRDTLGIDSVQFFINAAKEKPAKHKYIDPYEYRDVIAGFGFDAIPILLKLKDEDKYSEKVILNCIGRIANNNQAILYKYVCENLFDSNNVYSIALQCMLNWPESVLKNRWNDLQKLIRSCRNTQYLANRISILKEKFGERENSMWPGYLEFMLKTSSRDHLYSDDVCSLARYVLDSNDFLAIGGDLVSIDEASGLKGDSVISRCLPMIIKRIDSAIEAKKLTPQSEEGQMLFLDEWTHYVTVMRAIGRHYNFLINDEWARESVFLMDADEIGENVRQLNEFLELWQEINKEIVYEQRVGVQEFGRTYLPLVFRLELIFPGSTEHLTGLLKKSRLPKAIVRYLDAKKDALKDGKALSAFVGFIHRVGAAHRKKFKPDITAYSKVLNYIGFVESMGFGDAAVDLLNNFDVASLKWSDVPTLPSYLMDQLNQKMNEHFYAYLGIDKQEVQNIQTPAWLIFYTPFFTRIKQAYDYIRGSNYGKIDQFRGVIRSTVLGNFWDYIENTDQPDSTGRQIAIHNKSIRDQVRVKGVDDEKWLGKNPELRMKPASFDYQAEKGEINHLSEDARDVIIYIQRVLTFGMTPYRDTLIGLLTRFGIKVIGDGFNPGVVLNRDSEVHYPTIVAAVSEMLEPLMPLVAEIANTAQSHNMPSNVTETLVHFKESVELALKRKKLADSGEVLSQRNVRSFTIRPILRKPEHDLFIGDFTSCCLAMSSNSFPDAMIDRLIDEGINVIEVIDESTGLTMAAAWLFLAEDGSLVIQNLEISSDYQIDPELKNRVGVEMIQYAAKFADYIGSKRLYIGQPGHGKYFGAGGLIATLYKDKEISFGLKKIGGYFGSPYYLDSAGKPSAYLAWDKASADTSPLSSTPTIGPAMLFMAVPSWIAIAKACAAWVRRIIASISSRLSSSKEAKLIMRNINEPLASFNMLPTQLTLSQGDPSYSSWNRPRNFRGSWHLMTTRLRTLSDTYLEVETALKVIGDYTLTGLVRPPMTDPIYYKRDDYKQKTETLERLLAILPEIQKWQEDTKRFITELSIKQLRKRKNPTEIRELINSLDLKISIGNKWLDLICQYDNGIQKSQKPPQNSGPAGDPTILGEGSRVMARTEHEKKQERLKGQIEEIAAALDEVCEKLLNVSHTISEIRRYRKGPGEQFLFDMRLAAQEILANRSKITPDNNIIFDAKTRNRFTLKMGFGASARDVVFELKNIIIDPGGGERRNQMGEREIPLESYNILEIIDPTFDLNHAGRNALTTYAQTQGKSVHEFTELSYWIKFARRMGIASKADIENHKLGDKIRLWVNTTPRVTVEEQTQAAHDYACLNELEFMLNKKASPDTIALAKEKLSVGKRSALKFISDTEAELEITDSDNEWELDVSPDGKAIRISEACLENRSPEFIEHRVVNYVNYRKRLYEIIVNDPELSQSYKRDPNLYNWMAKLLCEHMWLEAIARDGRDGALAVSDLWSFYNGDFESAAKQREFPDDFKLKFIETSPENLIMAPILGAISRENIGIRQAKAEDAREKIEFLRGKLERNLAEAQLVGPELEDSVEVDTPIFADTKPAPDNSAPAAGEAKNAGVALKEPSTGVFKSYPAEEDEEAFLYGADSRKVSADLTYLKKLILLLQSPHVRMRMGAALMLANIAYDAHEQEDNRPELLGVFEEAVPFLLANLDHEDATVRGNNANALGHLGRPLADPAIPRIEELLDDPAPIAHNSSYNALLQLGFKAEELDKIAPFAPFVGSKATSAVLDASAAGALEVGTVRVLDIGSGDGVGSWTGVNVESLLSGIGGSPASFKSIKEQVTDMFRARNVGTEVELVGIDIKPDRIKSARDSGYDVRNIDLFDEETMRKVFPDNSLDVITWYSPQQYDQNTVNSNMGREYNINFINKLIPILKRLLNPNTIGEFWLQPYVTQEPKGYCVADDWDFPVIKEIFEKAGFKIEVRKNAGGEFIVAKLLTTPDDRAAAAANAGEESVPPGNVPDSPPRATVGETIEQTEVGIERDFPIALHQRLKELSPVRLWGETVEDLGQRSRVIVARALDAVESRGERALVRLLRISLGHTTAERTLWELLGNAKGAISRTGAALSPGVIRLSMDKYQLENEIVFKLTIDQAVSSEEDWAFLARNAALVSGERESLASYSADRQYGEYKHQRGTGLDNFFQVADWYGAFLCYRRSVLPPHALTTELFFRFKMPPDHWVWQANSFPRLQKIGVYGDHTWRCLAELSSTQAAVLESYLNQENRAVLRAFYVDPYPALSIKKFAAWVDSGFSDPEITTRITNNETLDVMWNGSPDAQAASSGAADIPVTGPIPPKIIEPNIHEYPDRESLDLFGDSKPPKAQGRPSDESAAAAEEKEALHGLLEKIGLKYAETWYEDIKDLPEVRKAYRGDLSAFVRDIENNLDHPRTIISLAYSALMRYLEHPSITNLGRHGWMIEDLRQKLPGIIEKKLASQDPKEKALTVWDLGCGYLEPVLIASVILEEFDNHKEWSSPGEKIKVVIKAVDVDPETDGKIDMVLENGFPYDAEDVLLEKRLTPPVVKDLVRKYTGFVHKKENRRRIKELGLIEFVRESVTHKDRALNPAVESGDILYMSYVLWELTEEARAQVLERLKYIKEGALVYIRDVDDINIGGLLAGIGIKTTPLYTAETDVQHSSTTHVLIEGEKPQPEQTDTAPASGAAAVVSRVSQSGTSPEVPEVPGVASERSSPQDTYIIALLDAPLDDTVTILENQYTVAAYSINGVRYLQTYDAADCNIVAMYDSKLKVGVMAHVPAGTIDVKGSFAEIFNKLESLGSREADITAYIAGGNKHTLLEAVNIIENELNSRNIKIVRIKENGLINSLVLDVSNGSLYRVKNKDSIEKVLSIRLSKHRHELIMIPPEYYNRVRLWYVEPKPENRKAGMETKNGIVSSRPRFEGSVSELAISQDVPAVGSRTNVSPDKGAAIADDRASRDRTLADTPADTRLLSLIGQVKTFRANEENARLARIWSRDTEINLSKALEILRKGDTRKALWWLDAELREIQVMIDRAEDEKKRDGFERLKGIVYDGKQQILGQSVNNGSVPEGSTSRDVPTATLATETATAEGAAAAVDATEPEERDVSKRDTPRSSKRTGGNERKSSSGAGANSGVSQSGTSPVSALDMVGGYQAPFRSVDEVHALFESHGFVFKQSFGVSPDNANEYFFFHCVRKQPMEQSAREERDVSKRDTPQGAKRTGSETSPSNKLSWPKGATGSRGDPRKVNLGEVREKQREVEDAAQIAKETAADGQAPNEAVPNAVVTIAQDDELLRWRGLILELMDEKMRLFGYPISTQDHLNIHRIPEYRKVLAGLNPIGFANASLGINLDQLNDLAQEYLTINKLGQEKETEARQLWFRNVMGDELTHAVHNFISDHLAQPIHPDSYDQLPLSWNKPERRLEEVRIARRRIIGELIEELHGICWSSQKDPRERGAKKLPLEKIPSIKDFRGIYEVADALAANILNTMDRWEEKKLITSQERKKFARIFIQWLTIYPIDFNEGKARKDIEKVLDYGNMLLDWQEGGDAELAHPGMFVEFAYEDEPLAMLYDEISALDYPEKLFSSAQRDLAKVGGYVQRVIPEGADRAFAQEILEGISADIKAQAEEVQTVEALEDMVTLRNGKRYPKEIVREKMVLLRNFYKNSGLSFPVLVAIARGLTLGKAIWREADQFSIKSMREAKLINDDGSIDEVTRDVVISATAGSRIEDSSLVEVRFVSPVAVEAEISDIGIILRTEKMRSVWNAITSNGALREDAVKGTLTVPNCTKTESKSKYDVGAMQSTHAIFDELVLAGLLTADYTRAPYRFRIAKRGIPQSAKRRGDERSPADDISGEKFATGPGSRKGETSRGDQHDAPVINGIDFWRGVPEKDRLAVTKIYDTIISLHLKVNGRMEEEIYCDLQTLYNYLHGRKEKVVIGSIRDVDELREIIERPLFKRYLARYKYRLMWGGIDHEHFALVPITAASESQPETQPQPVYGVRNRKPVKVSGAEFLEVLKEEENNGLLAQARSADGVIFMDVARRGGIDDKAVYRETKILEDLGILVPARMPKHYRLADIFIGPDANYTRTMINMVNNVKFRVKQTGDERPLHRKSIPEKMIALVKEILRLHVTDYIYTHIKETKATDKTYAIRLWDGYGGMTQKELLQMIRTKTENGPYKITFEKLEDLANPGNLDEKAVVILPLKEYDKLDESRKAAIREKGGVIFADLDKPELEVFDAVPLEELIGAGKAYLNDDEESFYILYRSLTGYTSDDYRFTSLAALKDDPYLFVKNLRFVLKPITTHNLEELTAINARLKYLLESA